MFASQIIENYNAQIAAVTTEIAEVEKYLADLRAREAALETEKQAALTLEAAGQSALDQTRQFLALARAHDKMIEAFWTRIDEIRNEQLTVGDLPFAEAPDDTVDEAETITFEPDEDTGPRLRSAREMSDTDTETNSKSREPSSTQINHETDEPSQKGSLDFRSTSIEDNPDEPVSEGQFKDIIETKTEQVIAKIINGNGHHLTLSDFKGYTLAQLKKIALKKGVKTKQGKDALAADLSSLHLEQEEVDKLLV